MAFTVEFKSTLNDRFLSKFFMAILLTLRVFVNNFLINSWQTNIFSLCRRPLTWGLNCGLLSQQTTYQTTATILLYFKEIIVEKSTFFLAKRTASTFNLRLGNQISSWSNNMDDFKKQNINCYILLRFYPFKNVKTMITNSLQLKYNNCK